MTLTGFMRANGLKRADVERLATKAGFEKWTAISWFRSPDDKGKRTPPARSLTLLQLEVEKERQ